MVDDGRPVFELDGIGQVDRIVAYGHDVPVEIGGHIAVTVVIEIVSRVVIIVIFLYVIGRLVARYIGNSGDLIAVIVPRSFVYQMTVLSSVTIQHGDISLFVVCKLFGIAFLSVFSGRRVCRNQSVLLVVDERISIGDGIGIVDRGSEPFYRRYFTVVTRSSIACVII